MGIRENLSALMAHRQITAYALAKVVGVPQPTIFRILDGTSADPKTATVAKLALYFGVTVEELRGTQSGLTLHDEGEGLSEEALEVARIWMGLPEARRRSIKESLFILSAAMKVMPWLVQGRPPNESYSEFERRIAHIAEERRHPSPPAPAPTKAKK